MRDALFEHLGRILDVAPEQQTAAIGALGLSPADDTRLRALLDHATRPSEFDKGIGAVFPTLVSPAPPEIDGFRIERELGRGGMGVVYLAEDTTLERFVAIKVIPQGKSGTGQAFDEARNVARLDHHGIVPVYHCGTLPESTYIVSAYVEGETLADRLAGHRDSCDLDRSDRRPLRRGEAPTNRRWIDLAAGWAQSVATAIAYAHGRGVVHRDLKPSNILLDAADSVSIADFGISTMLGRDDPASAAGPIGSLAYMSPEQAGCPDVQANPDIDARTDVYSLGVVLFELLTLRRPHEPTSITDLWRHFDQEKTLADVRRLNPAVPRQLAEVCRKALSRDPSDRFASATTMAEAINEALCGEFDTGELSLAPLRRFLRRRRIAAAVIAAVAITAMGTAFLFTRPPPPHGTLRFVTATPDRVIARPISPDDRMPGPAVTHATDPDRLKLDPGRYRIVVIDGTTRRELTRVITQGESLSIDLSHLPPPRFRDDMVLVSGGTYVVGATDLPHRALQPRQVAIEPFMIDRCEVSNADYREFVLATGSTPPPHWPSPYDTSWDRLPVSGVSQYDARAFAEWVGKRLPTDTEWEIAAAGSQSRPYPWSHASESSVDSEPGGMFLLQSRVDPGLAAVYLEKVRPVRSDAFPGDVSPVGARFMGGNVAEWTDSVLMMGDVASSGYSPGIIKGNAWAAQKSPPPPSQHSMITDPEIRLIGVGFRCAVSIPDQG